MADQFIRAVSLFVTKANVQAGTKQALDLSDMRIVFTINNADVETPNTAYIRVYNLKTETTHQVIKEYDNVVLQAGYRDGNFGIIFRGTIKQFHKGKENSTDSYLDILAADGDIFYNFGSVNVSLDKSKTSPLQQAQTLSQAWGAPLDPNAAGLLTGGILPRGKVLFGMCRASMRNIAQNASARWSIQDGTITVIPLRGYLPGQAVKINSATGMRGIPEATDNGIVVNMSLNPLIQVGGSVQLNEADVTQTIVREQFFPSFNSSPTLVANVTTDGFYRVLVVEHAGDTRGQEWTTKLTCLSLDPSSKPANSVQAFG